MEKDTNTLSKEELIQQNIWIREQLKKKDQENQKIKNDIVKKKDIIRILNDRKVFYYESMVQVLVKQFLVFLSLIIY